MSLTQFVSHGQRLLRNEGWVASLVRVRAAEVQEVPQRCASVDVVVPQSGLHDAGHSWLVAGCLVVVGAVSFVVALCCSRLVVAVIVLIGVWAKITDDQRVDRGVGDAAKVWLNVHTARIRQELQG
jgi:hypothetical protein